MTLYHMTQTREVRNDRNIIQTDIESLVDTGSLDLLSDTLDVPLQGLVKVFRRVILKAITETQLHVSLTWNKVYYIANQ